MAEADQGDAGAPRGSWPAEEFAASQRDQGIDARVVMDLKSDQFLVVTDTLYPPAPWCGSCATGP
jgi:hypothetical protein